jgi:ketosteroid isomerase-like protein
VAAWNACGDSQSATLTKRKSASGAVYRGRAAIRQGFRDLFDALAETHIDYPDTRDLGDRVVAIGRIRTRGKGSGAVTESVHAAVVDFRDGKGIRVRAYLDPSEALKAAGLER